ncbi:MATE family efflux transporter [Paenibacillus sp.]|uniref:MATE family efflux transporter n=1 Tax=Paenibacillus sp. TaxID=58172 RepID=UPI002D5A2820|nr:MATE family efflux transporter [Paenibacillus sp.]HZG55979.1 MATE family efflux transporter [Paenibacillus sp.]
MLNIHRPRRAMLFWISWPIFIELFLSTFMRSADTLMLSFVSDEAVGAVGIANQFIFFAFVFFSVLSAGSAIVVAQYLGAGKRNEIVGIVSSSVAISFLVGLVMSSIVILHRSALLGWFRLDANQYDDANAYLVITGSALCIQAMTMTMSAVIQAHGYTKQSMYINIIMNVVNIAGNYLFIFGAFGFPKLDVVGVSISTVISQCLGFLITCRLLHDKIGVSFRNWRHFVFWNREDLKKIVGIGLPAAGEHFSYVGAQIVTTMFITALGITMLTTMIYTVNITSYIFIFLMAISRGTQILTGHFIGAGLLDKAYKQGIRSLYAGLGIALVLAGCSGIWGERFLSLFTKDESIIQLGASLLLLGLVLEPGRTFNIVIGHALRAAGDTRFMSIVSVLSMWCISVPLSYWLGVRLGFGLYGIWLAYILDEWVRGSILFYRWRSRRWERKRFVDSVDAGGKKVHQV